MFAPRYFAPRYFPPRYFTPAAGAVLVEATISGTALDALETAIRAGGRTVVITLVNETWVAAGATFNAVRQDIIDGLDSAQSETTGWNNEIRDKEVVTAVVRTSDTVVTITLSASAAYAITANETITVTVPSSAMVGMGAPVTGSPTITIVDVAEERGGSSRRRPWRRREKERRGPPPPVYIQPERAKIYARFGTNLVPGKEGIPGEGGPPSSSLPAPSPALSGVASAVRHQIALTKAESEIAKLAAAGAEASQALEEQRERDMRAQRQAEALLLLWANT